MACALLTCFLFVCAVRRVRDGYQVCEVVLREGLAFIPAAAQDTGLSPKCVPQVSNWQMCLINQGGRLYGLIDC